LRLVVTGDGPGKPTGWATLKNRRYRCALGRAGIAKDKREGDGATPEGVFPLRLLYYRPDRGEAPQTSLAMQALASNDGWCDAPGDSQYNRLVRLPYPASHEKMWRADGIYDLVLVIGHNDDPPQSGLGSAIFLHLARDDYAPTEGCVAFSRPDFAAILTDLGPDDRVEILAPNF
jgi:L,D-peptidoglycan transpeptidase YkuD (ErfK/YbiS/YcfS/YnhG family)